MTFDKNGTLFLTVPLADGEQRRFVLSRGDQTTLAKFAENLQKEGVTNDSIVFKSEGVQLAQETQPAWSALSYSDIQLFYGGQTVQVEKQGEAPAMSLEAANDHSKCLQEIEQQLNQQVDKLNKELEPLDNTVREMLDSSHRRTRAMAWLGLAFMASQFGFLARLTWWDYSWDIVEPISYFVTYGTGIFFYAYYVVTKQEANFADMFTRQQLITMHKRMAKTKFDVNRYNKLRDELTEVETRLTALRLSPEYQLQGKTSSAGAAGASITPP